MGWFRDMFVAPRYRWYLMNPLGRGESVDPKVTEAYRKLANQLRPGLTGPFPPEFRPFGSFWEKKIDG